MLEALPETSKSWRSRKVLQRNGVCALHDGWGNIGVLSGLYWWLYGDDREIVEKEMETTIIKLGFTGLGFRVQGLAV